MNLSDTVAKQIAVTLAEMSEEDKAFEAKVQELEAQGYRITNGGQIGNSNRCKYTDWRTGKVLARRDKQLPENCYHVDHIHHETTVLEPQRVEGLPVSLAEILIQWTCDHEEEARELAEVIAATQKGEDR